MKIGSPVECIYALQSFGISAKQIPLNTSTGELNLTNHNRWLELCAAKEENLKLYERIIECPNHSDILFGRGHIVMRHPGNALFRSVIQSKLKEYSSIQSKTWESTKLTLDVVWILKNEYGARFLKEETVETDGLCWVEVSNDIARGKVRVAFRDARRTRLAKSRINDNSNGSNNGTTTTTTTTTTTAKKKTKRKSKTAANTGAFSSSSPSLAKQNGGETTTPDSTLLLLDRPQMINFNNANSNINDKVNANANANVNVNVNVNYNTNVRGG